MILTRGGFVLSIKNVTYRAEVDDHIVGCFYDVLNAARINGVIFSFYKVARGEIKLKTGRAAQFGN
jgi:hypothetical protein